MKAQLMSNLIYPMLRRVGSVVAGLAIGYGVNETSANDIATGVVALLAIAVDLISSKYFPRKEI